MTKQCVSCMGNPLAISSQLQLMSSVLCHGAVYFRVMCISVLTPMQWRSVTTKSREATLYTCIYNFSRYPIVSIFYLKKTANSLICIV
jgi:hypothetical protein